MDQPETIYWFSTDLNTAVWHFEHQARVVKQQPSSSGLCQHNII